MRILGAVLWSFLFLGLAGGPVLAQENAREFRECTDCPQMVGIPAGSFTMGSPLTENGRFNSEGPQHVVSLKAFALGKYPVTSEEFIAFLRDTGYQPAPCNPILDMKWSTPKRGLAFPPSTAEPPKMACCMPRLARCTGLHRVAE